MFKTTLKLQAWADSDIGLIRDHNEDTWYSDPDYGLFIIADGMGGHSAGEVASQMAVLRLKESIIEIERRNRFKKYSSLEILDQVKKSVQKINKEIYKRGEKEKELKGMGTTLSILYILDEKGYIAHVGDSRIYRLNHLDKRPHIEQITQDHSLVAELVEMGQLSPDQVEQFPFKHILTRSIGTHSSVEVSTYMIDLKNEDVFLMCTDGLTNYVSEREIEDIVYPFSNLEMFHLPTAGQQLINLAKEHGGGDNITIVLIKTKNNI